MNTLIALFISLSVRHAKIAHSIRTGVLGYLMTTLFVLLALLLRFTIAPIDAGLQYVTFFPAVVIASIIAGYRAGLLATFIGMCFANYFFTAPYYSFAHEALKLSASGNLIFVLDGIILSFTIELVHGFLQRYAMQLAEVRISEQALNALNVQLSNYISQLEVNEQALRKFAALIESSDDAIISKSLAGIIQSWNHGAEIIFGYTAAEIIGQSMTTLIPADHLDEEPEILAKIARGEKVSHFETVRRCKDGSLINISATISPIFDAHGTVVGVSKIARNITERKQLEAKVNQLAFYDPLTSLPNRRLLYDRLKQLLATNKRSGCYAALLFIDLDNFKPLNDLYGHDAGDVLLQEVANRLRNIVRAIDTVARFGGDEFVVLLNELAVDNSIASSEASLIGEKIRAKISEAYALQVNTSEATTVRVIAHCCSASIGIALFRHQHETADAILKRADTAMYQAKHHGRNVICFSAAPGKEIA